MVATLVITLFVRSAKHPTKHDLPTLIAIGATDAGANGLYAIAAHFPHQRYGVFASLYPAVTALLAWRFHHERLRRIQVVGVAATLLGVGLMAAGSA